MAVSPTPRQIFGSAAPPPWVTATTNSGDDEGAIVVGIVVVGMRAGGGVADRGELKGTLSFQDSRGRIGGHRCWEGD